MFVFTFSTTPEQVYVSNEPLSAIVGNFLDGRRPLKILEAGCGSMGHVSYDNDAYIVGIDISQVQLDRNPILKERILGDIEDYPLPESTFDLIICWDVLEHLKHPDRALRNFARTVNEGGIILLASPNVMTVRGLLTKFTPHWVHVLYYKRVVGLKDAGKPGHYPFKAYHRFSMTPFAITRFGKKHNLQVEACWYTSWEHPENSIPLFNLVWSPLNRAINLITFGAIGTDKKQGFQLMLRKKSTE